MKCGTQASTSSISVVTARVARGVVAAADVLVDGVLIFLVYFDTTEALVAVAVAAGAAASRLRVSTDDASVLTRRH